ncbi:hypothetical protein VTN49DRAFT_6039 [Thermomyces lanuginosus]|uniref:uncharacterized protein n=1 Tax=Thermomyces lanuginosus TaxID=5541 RepID=UPI003742A8CD
MLITASARAILEHSWTCHSRFLLKRDLAVVVSHGGRSSVHRLITGPPTVDVHRGVEVLTGRLQSSCGGVPVVAGKM